MSLSDSVAEATSLIERWEREVNDAGADPVSILSSLSELVEKETEAWLKMDPDPFDDRHPGKSQPDCGLGHVLKVVLKNEVLASKIMGQYLDDREGVDTVPLKTVCCRLFLSLLPGMEPELTFQDSNAYLKRLLSWAEGSIEPLASYSTGILGAAMAVTEVAAEFKEQNGKMVPFVIDKLHSLLDSSGDVACGSKAEAVLRPVENYEMPLDRSASNASLSDSTNADSTSILAEEVSILNENSSSSWVEQEADVIGSYQLWPLLRGMQQRLLLQYLIPLAEYQELLAHALKHRALRVILRLLDMRTNSDVRLVFETTKYCAALLCHKKFTQDFIRHNGVQYLLAVRRPSVAATGVSLCLYYLSYYEEALEMACQQGQSVLSKVMKYALWLLECSHTSGRMHSVMFLTHALGVGCLQRLFTHSDGLRKMMNILSTSPLLTTPVYPPAALDMSEDDQTEVKQLIHCCCMATRVYLQVCLVAKAQLIGGRQHIQDNRPLALTDNLVLECEEQLLNHFGRIVNFEGISRFIELGGPTILMQLLPIAAEWNAPLVARNESIVAALDCLAVCLTWAQGQQAVVCDGPLVQLSDGQKVQPMYVFLCLASGQVISDPGIQKASLHCIANCVCTPEPKNFSTPGKDVKRKSMKLGDDVLTSMWDKVRTNSGIMILLKLLETKTPVSEADSVRALACKVLAGLARCENVQQIMSKLPLYTGGEIQALMKEPVLSDKKAEYLQCVHWAKLLLKRVSGKPVHIADTSEDKIRRTDVITHTRITYKENELLQLMHAHLLKLGLSTSAEALQKEAQLPECSQSLNTSFATPQQSSTPLNSSRYSNVRPLPPPISPAGHSRPFRPNHKYPLHHSSKMLSPGAAVTPGTSSQSWRKGWKKETVVTPRLVTCKPAVQEVGLSDIVTEYLRKQHESCEHPVSTCPPFSLKVPHHCPEPRRVGSSLTRRMFNRMYSPRYGTRLGAQEDRRFIYSRFRSLRSVRDENEEQFTCCVFCHDQQHLMLGTYTGELKKYNIDTGAEVASITCHDSGIHMCELRDEDSLVLTCSTFSDPTCVLWLNKDGLLENRLSFNDDTFVEFGKASSDKLLGTKNKIAKIYDTGTGQVVRSYYDSNLANHYVQNKATLDPSDELLLNDGVLWDVDSCRAIHKFDKLSTHLHGALFNPNGVEVIINCQVWDIRTFRLLHTVPTLDQCSMRFNTRGDVLFGIASPDDEVSEDEPKSSGLHSIFRTFDARDYSNIAAIDVKHSIVDLITNSSDTLLAVVEHQEFDSETLREENCCRLFDIGRGRADGEEEVEEDMEQEDDEEGETDMEFNFSDLVRDDDGDDDDDDRNDDNNGDDAGNADGDDDDDDDDSNDDDEFQPNSDIDSVESSSLSSDSGDEIDRMLFELSDTSNGAWNL